MTLCGRRLLLPLALLACSAAPEARPIEAAPTDARVRAPSLEGGAWLNAEPVTLEALAGHVVVLVFWRRDSLESLYALADLSELARRLADRPFLVVGVHGANGGADGETERIATTLRRHGLELPVVVDTAGVIAARHEVERWPTIVAIDVDGGVVSRWAGEPEPGGIAQTIERLLGEGERRGMLAARGLPWTPAASSPEALSFPTKVAVAATGQVAIADSGHHRIVVAEADGTVVDVAGSGLAGSVDGAFEIAAFRGPQGLAFDESGRVIFVADTDNHQLRRLDLDARTVTTMAGTGARARRIAEGPALGVGLRSPRDLVLEGDAIYIAMAGAHQIWRQAGGRLSLVAGEGREGTADGALDEASFSQPSGLAFAEGALYVVDAGTNAVRVIASDRVTTLVAGRSAARQHALGIAARGDELYLGLDDALDRLLPDERRLETVASGWAEPGGLATLPDGRLLVADTNHHRLMLFDPVSGERHDWPLVGLSPPSARGVVMPTRVRSDRAVAVRARGALGPGRNTLVIDIVAPLGGKLTEGAPIVLEAEALGAGIGFPEPRLRDKIGAGVPPLRLALDLAPEHQGEIRLVVDYFWCTDNADAGACIPARVLLDVSFERGAGPGEAHVAVQSDAPH
jgi:DNA-binding beta-propeller fold protein YncE